MDKRTASGGKQGRIWGINFPLQTEKKRKGKINQQTRKRGKESFRDSPFNPLAAEGKTKNHGSVPPARMGKKYQSCSGFRAAWG